MTDQKHVDTHTHTQINSIKATSLKIIQAKSGAQNQQQQ